MSSIAPPSPLSHWSRVLSLDGLWKLRWNDGERGERSDRVASGGVDWTRGWEAEVPGCVHGALLATGVIPDPNLGTNVLACRWVEETIWIYRRTFSCTAVSTGSRAWLRFEKLDLAARILLNGKFVGEHANAFRPFEAEVTKQLVDGENELIVEIESGLYLTRDRSAAGLGVKTNYLLTKMPWMRKTQSQHGWDWAPRLLNVGIPGSVALEIKNGPRWERSSVSVDLAENLRSGTVEVRIFVDVPNPCELEITVKVAGAEVKQIAAIEAGRQALEVRVPVENPALWWPVGHGDQALYKVEIEVRHEGNLVGIGSHRVGFRHIQFCQDPLPEGGRRFTLRVNGKPVFCKGGNYVPTDLLLSRIDRARHAANIALALEANFNFLRVWGGGLYESDDFYDLCDEQGILVWQDFIFACAKYPATDEVFLQDVQDEVRHQVRRLRHHASLIAWCGNNEMEWAAWDWGFEKGIAHPDHALFHLVFPRLLQQEDPGRYYQPSSPWSPDGENPNSDLCGDQHAWQIGFGETDFRKYRDMVCRFPSEWGFLGPNSLPAVRAALAGGPERPGTFAWEIHDNSLSSWDSIPPYTPDRIFEESLGVSIKQVSIEDYVFFGGIVQGSALAEGIRNFRRRMFTSSAAVFWMFNEAWPATRSWGIADALGCRTPAFWPVRRAMASLAVFVVRDDDIVRIFAVNDGRCIDAELHFGLVSLFGDFPHSVTQPVEIPSNAATMVAEFSTARWDELGVKSHVAFARLMVGGKEVARDTLILPLFREMDWPEARIEVHHKNEIATFTCDSVAWRVCLDLDGHLPLTDNFFDILPGIPTELPWPISFGKPTVLRVGNELAGWAKTRRIKNPII